MDLGNMLAVDFSRIQAAADGDRDFEVELFTMYLEDTAQRVEAIGNSLRTGNWEAVHLEAHNVKGASGNVGAVPMQACCTSLEITANAQDSAGALEIYAILTAEFARVQLAVRDYLAS